MRAKIISLTSASTLVLAAFAAAPAGAIQIAPSAGAIDGQVIHVQDRGDRGDRGSGGPGPGASGRDGRGSGGPGPSAGGQRGSDGPAISGRAPSGGDRSGPTVNRSERPSVSERSRGDGPRLRSRDSGDARVQYESRRGDRGDRDYRDGRRGGEWRGNLTRRGWSRDRRHVFYGGVLLGVPFGYSAVAAHPCYEWAWGPQGWAYYWDYYRCPV